MGLRNAKSPNLLRKLGVGLAGLLPLASIAQESSRLDQFLKPFSPLTSQVTMYDRLDIETSLVGSKFTKEDFIARSRKLGLESKVEPSGTLVFRSKREGLMPKSLLIMTPVQDLGWLASIYDLAKIISLVKEMAGEEVELVDKAGVLMPIEKDGLVYKIGPRAIYIRCASSEKSLTQVEALIRRSYEAKGYSHLLSSDSDQRASGRETAAASSAMANHPFLDLLTVGRRGQPLKGEVHVERSGSMAKKDSALQYTIRSFTKTKETGVCLYENTIPS